MLMFTPASAPAPHSSRRPIFTPDLSLLRSRLLPTPMIAPPRCPVLASTLRYPTAISEYAPATEAEAPDPGGAAQVSDVAPDPALPVEDGPALPVEDGRPRHPGARPRPRPRHSRPRVWRHPGARPRLRHPGVRPRPRPRPRHADVRPRPRRGGHHTRHPGLQCRTGPWPPRGSRRR